ncbi:phage protein Gp36 family protein [Caballeronia sp. LZ001]|uniref:gp436 family protein n=1 Tax=Caballeronia sp. LZ001 TaxID=3038553 RepID=UPI00285AF10E|nr:phage protein Gp36 family protein [Caballeronia sp. LZ001]MDR5803406.1 DUF1320 family protein [Caballeronia sp. LZ001]
MYACVEAMRAQFGERELIALSDRERTGVVDSAVVSAAIDDASSEIDSYLAGRYRLPLDPAPKMLSRVCCDIARYLLCGADARMTEEIRQRYKDATGFLKLVANGDVTLGVTATGSVPESDNPIQFEFGARVFDRRCR